MNRLTKKTTRSGMTLVEVMVVVAIVALIAVIAYPVFGKARESSRMARSASALRQIHIGMTMYAQEYDAKATYGKGSDMGLPERSQWIFGADSQHVPAELWHQVYNPRAIEYLNPNGVPPGVTARFNYLVSDDELWTDAVKFWGERAIYIYDWTIPKRYELENPAYLQTYQVLRINGAVELVRIYQDVGYCQNPRRFRALPKVCGGLKD